MTTFVLVHGAWHGGWCWERVAAKLREAGHRVLTPTLTGLSEAGGLTSHVSEVISLLLEEDLRKVVLVGHDYGGMVITGALVCTPGRISRVVYIDALMPESGQCARDLQPDLQVPPPSARELGLQDAADLAWVDQHLTPMPSLAFEEPLEYGTLPPIEQLYIRTTWPSSHMDACYAAAPQRALLNASHDAMVDAPGEVAALLL